MLQKVGSWLTEGVGVGAEGEGVDDLVLVDGARRLHVLHAVRVDAAARAQQQHPGSLGLSATHTPSY